MEIATDTTTEGDGTAGAVIGLVITVGYLGYAAFKRHGARRLGFTAKVMG